MIRIFLVSLIVVGIIGGSVYLFYNAFGKKEVKSVPDTLAGNVEEINSLSPSPTSAPIPTPVPAKVEYVMDLNKELESVTPEVLSSDFEGFDNLLTTF